jgi:hypothetical protein
LIHIGKIIRATNLFVQPPYTFYYAANFLLRDHPAARIKNPKFYAGQTVPLVSKIAGTSVALDTLRELPSQPAILKRNEKAVTYERIPTPGAGCDLSHDFVSPQVETAEQRSKRTDAAFFGF